MESPVTRPTGDVLVSLTDVVKHFPIKSSALGRAGKEVVHAVDGVTLEIRQGETLGLVGETGCGKSTLARCVTRLFDITSGKIEFEGNDISKLSRKAMRPFRRDIQMIFQDPYGSLNPRRRVGSIIGDPLAIHGISSGQERKRAVQETMELVGLNPEHFNRFPAEFSGGQRQRIAIARALITRPRLIVADEPVSALDVSVQAQVLNLLADLQEQFGVTYLFISHDLAVVDHVCDEVAVMYAGRVVEQGTPEVLFRAAAHPYTRALMAALPQATVTAQPVDDPARAAPRSVIDGSSARVASAGNAALPATSQGCSFAERCPHARNYAHARCHSELPALRTLSNGHRAACHFAESVMTEVPFPGDRP